jgi:hypothetical protein
MTLSVYSITGWHTTARLTQEKPTLTYNDVNDIVLKHNVITVMGYVPIVGTLAGIAHIVMSKDANNLAGRVYAIARGILEIFGLGILFLIPDVIVSVHRHFCTSKPNAEK